MITLRSRKYGKDGLVMLSVRVKDKGRDNAVALGISVDSLRWQLIDQTIKNAREAQKRGATIFIDDALTSKLWMLLKELTVLQKTGTLSDDTLSNTIRAILHQEEITELKKVEERQEVQRMAAKPSFVEFVDQYISECENGERLKQKSTRMVMPGTIKNYKGFLAQVEEYQKSRHCVLGWDDFSMDFYKDFKQFFIEKNYSPNTIARHVKTMKTMLYAAKAMQLTTRDDFTSSQWSADREDVDNVYIPLERLKEMADFDMSSYSSMKERAKKYAKDDKERDNLIHALKRDLYRRKLSEARDIFVLGCLTGQRVSDYKRINKDMIETIVGEREFLHLVQVKTGKDVYVPYSDLIGRILDRYDGKLPKIYDQHLNERIKVVGLLLGWTEPAGLTEHKGLMSYQSSKRFCDAIKTHTARRTFATNAYKSNVPLSAIMAVTGHSSEEMLKRYLKLGSKERALLAAKEFDKLNLAI